jgi:hypothetical protein
MPALIAYLVCISLFLSGGYFGLNFLAENFDEPRSTVSLHSDKAQRAKEKQKNNISQMHVRAEVAQALSENSSAQSDAKSKDAYAEVKTAMINQFDLSADTSSQNQTAEVKRAISDAAPQEAAVSVEKHVSHEIDSRPRTAANDVRDHETSSSAFGVHEADGANDLADIAQKAKTTQSVTTTGLTFRPMTTSINSLLKSQSSSTIRKVRNIRRPKRSLVKMILQTIEFSDGHREQRLVSQRRASLEN